MVQCKHGTFYTGWTNDLKKRMAAHDAGKGAKYLRGRGPVKLVYRKECRTVAQAQALERSIKKLTRKEKEALVFL
ncbi:MAG: GIY-YIG nuclease family protein [Candidatus Omnitrophica bacterium]|nr:GIY-YIG nuclease family protein [Candidatus Omnitrophota bacterium]